MIRVSPEGLKQEKFLPSISRPPFLLDLYFALMHQVSSNPGWRPSSLLTSCGVWGTPVSSSLGPLHRQPPGAALNVILCKWQLATNSCSMNKKKKKVIVDPSLLLISCHSCSCLSFLLPNQLLEARVLILLPTCPGAQHRGEFKSQESGIIAKWNQSPVSWEVAHRGVSQVTRRLCAAPE